MENPKYVQALKDGKPRMEYLVGSVLQGDAKVHAHGADKYGERNWRIDPIKSSTYEAAILRHFMSYFYDREDADPDSGLSHLYHIRACCAVMIDAEIHGTLIDDRGRAQSGMEPEGEYNEDDPGHPENVHEYMRQLRRQDD
jgi:hypothetical protein